MRPQLADAVSLIVAARSAVPESRALLVAISGIDGSGKGFINAEISSTLTGRGYRTASINIDGWLRLPHERFDRDRPAEHFYEHAIRFEEMFAQLVLPLRNNRSVWLEAEFAEETATAFRPHLYRFDNIDIILLEGIFLLKREFTDFYDLSFWLRCDFETALRRAVARAQEGLPPEDTISAYHHIYFPAQRIHFERDSPETAATAVIDNAQEHE